VFIPKYLKHAIADAYSFCTEHAVNLAKIQTAAGLQRVELPDDAVEAIIAKDQSKQRYFLLAGNIAKLYRAILPDHLPPST
jgi:type I restriction enzyme R subunit